MKGSNFVMKICLKRLGYSYLTAENYQKFVTYPLTIVFIIIGCLFICLALIFEIHALFSCYESSGEDRKSVSRR